MNRKNIPFNFVFDYLLPLEVKIKPMFGMFALYVDEKIMLILRNREDHQNTNGVWVATQLEHHVSLKKELAGLCSISSFSDGSVETEWQVIPAEMDGFEETVIKACEFIKMKDPRIGRIPKPKSKTTKRPK